MDEDEEFDDEEGEEVSDFCAHCHQENAPDDVVSKKSKVPRDMLVDCSICKTHHHPACIELEDPSLICKIQSYDWHCSNCKVCQLCTSSGDDDKLLFCDLCDRGYHTFCLDPPLSALPEGMVFDNCD